MNIASQDWTKIPTKGASPLSKEEIMERVNELGIQFSNAASENEKEKIIQEKKELTIMLQSLVAPDRKALYEDAIKKITMMGDLNEDKPVKHDDLKNLIDYLNERDSFGIDGESKGMKFDKTYHFADGMPMTATRASIGGANIDVAFNGENVLGIKVGCKEGNGVYYYMTAAERVALMEINSVFDKAKRTEDSRTYMAADSCIDFKA